MIKTSLWRLEVWLRRWQLVAAARLASNLRSRLYRHDELTGLVHRAQAMRLLAKRAKAGRGALILADIDGFIFVNAEFGHLVGDRVLQDTARALETIVPSGTLVARVGGDEFLLYVDDATRATSVVERISSMFGNRFANERAQIEASLATQASGSPTRPILTLRASWVALAPFVGDLASAMKALGEADQQARSTARRGIVAAS